MHTLFARRLVSMSPHGEKNAITYPMQRRSVWMNNHGSCEIYSESASFRANLPQLALVVD